ncbi:hypothetical protein [Mesorhizobium sp. KR9-304]|uniref:hypothetical protein n=1 Tax=Mesorhizobium sp. KR9-304 TaxID=3156614 RepID=UPI0032B5E58F
MGHIRLNLPHATRKWSEVVALLDERDIRIASLAKAVEDAADKSLAHAVTDPAFVESMWLLLNIPLAAQERDFAAALRPLGLRVSPDPTMTDILAAFSEAADRARRVGGRRVTDFSVLARNAAMSALAGLAVERGPALWKASVEDQRTTLATFASTERFGELAQSFFTNILDGHLQYFLDREIPRHIGNGSSIRSVADTSYFESALRRHCRETTMIMRAYAKGWIGKNRYHLDKKLKREDAAAFAAYAFKKVRRELSIRGQAA